MDVLLTEALEERGDGTFGGMLGSVSVVRREVVVEVRIMCVGGLIGEV